MAGEETGAVEVVLTWEYTYLPASAKVIRKYPEVGVNPLSANPTKWSNTLKQFFGNSQRIV